MAKKILNISFYIIAAFYVFLMLDLFFRINIIASGGSVLRSYNLIPFKTILDYVSGNIYVSKSLVRDNILGNIIVFIPYGLYLQVLLKNKSFSKSLLIVSVTSILIEIIQFIFNLGAADIDDIILNVCGGVIGIIGYKVLRKIFHETDKTKTAVALTSLIVGTPVMLMYFMLCIRRYF